MIQHHTRNHFIMHRRFKTVGQYIYDTNKNKIHSVELLTRKLDGGETNLERFFKEADVEQLIPWFNQQIGEAIEFYRQTGIEAHVNIDLPTFKHITEHGAWEHEADDVQFTLEITKVQGLPDYDLINQIRNPGNFPSKWPWKGLQVALDDYEIENFNYASLAGKSFDIIKIDKSLVQKFETSNFVHTHLLYLLKNFDCDFIVEGVETIYQLRALQELGFRYFQGYYFHKPEPLERLIKKAP